MKLELDDTFTAELPADPVTTNNRCQVVQAAYSYVIPRQPTSPKLVHASEETAALLGITKEEIMSQAFLEVFSGSTPLEGAAPYAMVYGGHQFGTWAGQLGDGRAINIGEVFHHGQRWVMQLKGAGETPYSRSADGLAVLRSSIREHLCSEAMHHLRVPTTRSLSLILTGDEVMRDMMYDGNPELEKGAVVCRVAPSFLRFGNYQIFTARKDVENLKKLVDYTIQYFFPEIKTDGKEKYLDFYRRVMEKTVNMVIHWQRVGFVHGVMNTDNMSVLGLTIDYGPYGWLEGYDPGWTPNTTDRQTRRYRFGYQPNIAFWNLMQLGNALYPLIEDTEPLEEILNSYGSIYTPAYLEMMKSKIGLFVHEDGDRALIDDLEQMLTFSETDMTIFFRQLADFDPTIDIDLQGKYLEVVKDAFYEANGKWEIIASAWQDWFTAYQQRLFKENIDLKERKKRMNEVNPKYVLRNYMAQLAIDEADKGDYTLIDKLFTMLKQPYNEQPEFQKWFARRPEWARHKVGCSMLSCSS
ncbi:protein adenylyltransferase SelO [Portibacter marinus]|uniref:protein adenylyltransferase SelO n=1 Tax=Portibacter marinus TaxID=2898660 RepID=UPI001F27C47F|nr:YdiU family protein [Portibacter marinus]